MNKFGHDVYDQEYDLVISQSPLFDSLRRSRANAWNVSFRISLRWPIHIINPVDKTKLSYSYYVFYHGHTFFNMLYTVL